MRAISIHTATSRKGQAHHVSGPDDGGKRQAPAAPGKAGNLVPLDRPHVQRLAAELVLARPLEPERHRLVAHLRHVNGDCQRHRYSGGGYYESRQRQEGGRKTHPVTDEVGRADVDERADAALEQRGEVVVRREGGEVEGLRERPVDGEGVPLEVGPAHGRVHAEKRLDVFLVEEVTDVP